MAELRGHHKANRCLLSCPWLLRRLLDFDARHRRVIGALPLGDLGLYVAGHATASFGSILRWRTRTSGTNTRGCHSHSPVFPGLCVRLSISIRLSSPTAPR